MGKAEDLRSKGEKQLQSGDWKQARATYSEALRAELDEMGGLEKRKSFVCTLYIGRALAKCGLGEALPVSTKDTCQPPKYELPREDMLEDAMSDAQIAMKMDKQSGNQNPDAYYATAKVLMASKQFKEAAKVMKMAKEKGAEKASNSLISECESDKAKAEEEELNKWPEGTKVHYVEYPKDWENLHPISGVVQNVAEGHTEHRIGERVTTYVTREQIKNAQEKVKEDPQCLYRYDPIPRDGGFTMIAGGDGY